MPQLRQYKCSVCGYEFEELFKTIADVKGELPCPKCGETSTRQYQIMQVYIDDWSPMTMDAHRDIEHFEKKRVVGGKYRDKRTMYREDRMKASIPMNIKEV